MKENLCRQLDFDCWVNDFMAAGRSECILTDEGYDTIQTKYSAEIDKLIKEMAMQDQPDKIEEELRYQEYITANDGTQAPMELIILMNCHSIKEREI